MSPQEPLLSSASGKRVLIVDDDAMMVDILAELLEDVGHAVSTANDGQAALLAARERRPDVVLLDIDLPVMDGYELARQLRKDPHMGTVTIAALTGHGRRGDKRLAFEAGIDRHFCKPVSIQELIAFINQPGAATSAAAPPEPSTPATLPARPA